MVGLTRLRHKIKHCGHWCQRSDLYHRRFIVIDS